MDMRPFIGGSAGFLKPDTLGDPRQVKIADIRPGNFDRPVMVFDDGSKLSLNATNTRALTAVYGPESDDWIGKTIELYVGQVEFNRQLQDSVMVRPISPIVPPDKRQTPKPAPAKPDFDDDVPF